MDGETNSLATRRALLARLAAGIGAAGVVAIGGAAAAPPATPAQDLLVSNAWSRPTPKGLTTGVVYLTITNPGSAPDRLIGAASPVAKTMALHRSSMQNGVMSMVPVPGGAEVPAGGALRLQPGGYHFMLIGLKTGLEAGTSFPATLRFAQAGTLRIAVMVRSTPQPMTPMKGMQ